MRYQLHLYDEMSEYLNDVFSKFNSGFLTPDEAFEKVMLIRHEYGNLTENIPPEAEKLKIAVNALLSRIENYFIHYNYAFREDPELNLKLARARYELAQEVERLRFKYLY